MPKSTRKPQTSAQRDEVDPLIELLRQWIVEFQGEVAPLPSQVVNTRAASYINQELLYKEKVSFVLSLLPSLPSLALDLGSSVGGLSVALAMRGVTTVGIEPSHAGVEVSRMRAAKHNLSNTTFLQGVGESLPFDDATFDLIISLAVLEHVQNVQKVVAEVFRVLKPGGFAYFEVPNNLFPFEGHYKMAWFPMMPKWLAKHYVAMRGAFPEFLDHLHYMSRPIICRHFAEAGFVGCRDMAGEFLAGKASRAAWTESPGRLAGMAWSAPLIRLLFGCQPTGLFINRAVCLIARKSQY